MKKTCFSLTASLVVTFGASQALASTFGINAHVPMDPIADEIAEAGIGWVRIDFEWRLVEPERDRYDWRLYDHLIDRLEERGLQIYAGFGSTPGWATSGPEFSGVPDDPDEWQEFCYLAASRYRGRVDAWGIWNEPNSKSFWKGTRDQYIEHLLLPAATAIKAADPGALVCGPDLAHASSAHWDEWLEAVIRRAGDALDVLTHHIYPSYGEAFEVTYDLDQKLNIPFTSPSIRRLLKDHGWWGRPFWLTETGVESGRYGENGQAAYYENLLIDWFGPQPEARWMDRIFFYHMYDGPQPARRSFGIIESTPDLGRKSAFLAYQHFIREAAVDDAEIIAHGFPAFVDSATDIEVAVAVRNTGTTGWTPSTGHFLDARTDVDDWIVEARRAELRSEVMPGETAELTVRVITSRDTLGRPSVPVTVDLRMADHRGRRIGDTLRTKIVLTDHRPPAILTAPKAVTVPARRRTHFSVEVESDTPLSYRWRRNSVELEDEDGVNGSRTKWLRIRRATVSLEGDYDCVITNAAGSVVTSAVKLSLGATGPRRGSYPKAPAPPR